MKMNTYLVLKWSQSWELGLEIHLPEALQVPVLVGLVGI